MYVCTALSCHGVVELIQLIDMLAGTKSNNSFLQVSMAGVPSPDNTSSFLPVHSLVSIPMSPHSFPSFHSYPQAFLN